MSFRRLFRILGKRLLSLTRKDKLDAELHGELAFHYEQLVRQNLGAGMDAGEARLAARRALGDVSLFAEECRDHRRITWLEDSRKDIVFAGRVLFNSPVFTIVAVCSLALGIGANTAIFSLVYRALLESLPVQDPQGLFTITRLNLERDKITSFPYPFFQELARQDGMLAGIACRTNGSLTLANEKEADTAVVELVSGRFFDLLGVKPMLGRVFDAADDRAPGAHPVLVLSHNYWKRRFGADPAVMGKTVRVNASPMTIIGVLPPRFDGLRPGFSPDVYVPVMMQPQVWMSSSVLGSRGHYWLSLVARLRPGVTREQAEASLQPFLHGYLRQLGVPATPYARRVRESERIELKPVVNGLSTNQELVKPLFLLLAVVGIVLAIACVNLGNLLLARNSSRRHEFAVRLSLGASRFRLLRQLLTESLLIGLSGGVLGLGLALASGPLLVKLLAGDSPNLTLDPTPDKWILVFNFAVALVCSLLFGIPPAWHGIRQGFLAGLKQTRTVAGGRLLGRKLLLSGQVALTLVLLVGAALFLRTLQAIQNLDFGFRPEQLVQVTLAPETAGYRKEQVSPFFHEVKRRLEETRGVRSAGFAAMRAVANNEWGSGIVVEGFIPAENDPGPSRNAVSPDYFKAMGIPILRGRDFTITEANAPKVAIVNESFARFYFGGGDPIGRQIGRGGDGGKPDHTIIGLVRDTKYRTFREDSTRIWYVPLDASGMRSATLYVRADGDAGEALGLVRNVIAGIDKGVAQQNAKTVKTQIEEGTRQERMLATLSTFFALLAALLAAIGLYGVMSFSVSQRRREMGIRMALGASPGQVFSIVVREAARFGGLGFALAIPAVYAMGRVVKAALFGVQPMDPVAISGAFGLMAVVILVSAVFPASVASRSAPAGSLRGD